MGNCCMKGSPSATVWAGDDWGSVGRENKSSNEDEKIDHDCFVEKQRLLGDDIGGGLNSSSNSSYNSCSIREVKIKITKRELEELMGRIEMQGLTMEQVMASLINSPHHKYEFDHHFHRSWKPALQSIPEVN